MLSNEVRALTGGLKKIFIDIADKLRLVFKKSRNNEAAPAEPEYPTDDNGDRLPSGDEQWLL